MGIFPWSFGKSQSTPGSDLVHQLNDPNNKKSGNVSTTASSGQNCLVRSNLTKLAPLVSHTLPSSSQHPVAKPQPSRSKPNRSIDLPLAPALMNDPAFSVDPRSNPNFIAQYDSRNHHAKRQSFHPHTSSNTHNLNFTASQPPSFNERYAHPTLPVTPPTSDSTSSSNSTTSLSSIRSSSPPTPPIDVTFLAPQTISPSAKPSQPRSHKSLKPKIAQEVAYPSPSSAVMPSDAHQPNEESVLPSRVIATPEKPRSQAGANSLFLRVRELDRIDELDESDPLGLPWHHKGPYEAINNIAKLSVQDPADKGTYVDNVSGDGDTKPKTVRVSKFVRNGNLGVSLNLVPGQILPPIPFYDPTSLLPPHPLCRPQPQNHDATNYNDHGHYSGSVEPEPTYFDPYAAISQPLPNPHDLPPNYHQADLGPQPNSQRSSHYGAPANTVHGRHVLDSKKKHPTPLREVPPNVVAGKRHTLNKPDQHRRASVNYETQGRPERFSHLSHQQQPERPQPGPQVPKKSVSFEGHSDPNHARPHRNFPADGSRSSVKQWTDPQQQRRSGDLEVTTRHHPSHYAPVPDIPHQAPSLSASAKSQSFVSSIGSNKSGAHSSRYVPKNLVMPTPLQPLQEDTRMQQPPMSHWAHSYSSSNTSDSHYDGTRSHSRAQDIPMLTESRKLRKKVSSSLPHTSTIEVPPTYAGVGYSDPALYPKEHRVAPKRVLSKRRTNL